MSKQFTSPYATSFKSAVRRGTPWYSAVENIAKRYKKTPNYVWESLYKAGWCYRVKFNGQWMYWPKDAKKVAATNWKQTQYQMWQYYINWAVSAGWCTPEQIKKYATNQKQFMTWFRKFWGKQYTWKNTATTRTSRKRKATRTTRTRKATRTTRAKRTTASRRRTSTQSYKFPTARKRTTRRYRRAA